jgi:hypothetical protein
MCATEQFAYANFGYLATLINLKSPAMPSDQQVLDDVIAAFALVPDFKTSRFYVDVKSRVVTIRGRVTSVAQRQKAESIARGIVGLRALVLEVAIAPQSYVRPASFSDMTA